MPLTARAPLVIVAGQTEQMPAGDAVAVAAGGTGAVSLTAHGVLLGEGTAAVAVAGPGTAGQVFTSNGASADPSFQQASPSLGLALALAAGNVNP